MTEEMKWMGFLATLLIAVVLGINFIREPDRQENARTELMEKAVEQGTELFAHNCVTCHGAAGEGIVAYPPLNTEGVRSMDYTTLYKTIARGRANTAMAAYASDEGGIFTANEVDNLVTLIQHGSWSYIEERVAELGLTPPEIEVVEVSEETLASISALPDGDILASAMQVYGQNCAACHGANAEGTTVAPVLNDASVRERLTDADLIRIISQGVTGTVMAGWNAALTPEEIESLTTLIRRFDEIAAAGISIPVVEAEPIDMSPEAIVSGQNLFNLLCTQCHGANGYGTQIAPALNSQQFLQNTPDAAIMQIISLGVPGTRMPSWAGYLTDADIAAITAYLRSLEPTAPAVAPQTTTGAGGGQGGPPWQNTNP